MTSPATSGQRVASELEARHTEPCFWCGMSMHGAAHQYVGYHATYCLRIREEQRAWIHSDEADWLRSIPLPTTPRVAP